MRRMDLTAVAEGILLAMAVLGALMLLSESEDLSLSRFIAQKAGGVALIVASRLGWIGKGRGRGNGK